VLFRWRGAIGGAAFLALLALGRPTAAGCLQALPVIGLGLLVRFWASGYIGRRGRVRELGKDRLQNADCRVQKSKGGVQDADCRMQTANPGTRIVAGPYRVLRHPLYVGNALLVAGMVWALRPQVWVGAVVLALFLVEYALIIAAEERALAGLPLDRGARFRLVRAATEWSTWLVTGLAYGAAWLRAVLRG
jgi:hypothetical protein